MAGFNGLRVLSFESRRAKEIAHLIANNGGVPIVAPSTREVPEGPNEDEVKLIRGILAQEFDAVIFMTGVGARALIETAKTVSGENFLTALGKTAVVVRGPKPSAVMREFNVPVTLAVPEPNTWREIVSTLDANSQAVPLQGRRIAVQEHGEPSPELYAALRERGAEVFPVHVYRWELPEDIGPLARTRQSRNQCRNVHIICAVRARRADRRRTRSSIRVLIGSQERDRSLDRPNHIGDFAQERPRR